VPSFARIGQKLSDLTQVWRQTSIQTSVTYTISSAGYKPAVELKLVKSFDNWQSYP